ncbi:MAG: PD40 domain-containing protein [Phycisphaeraceae bacterium]|nr:PD40 domain-containing protein [Phycisphaeraceae bacterium]
MFRVVASFVLLLILSASVRAENVDFPRFPALSPDGSRVVFSWRGDLWLAPGDGGAAQRLTAHPADELRSAWSPDGARIVFESNRDGVRNLWVMAPDGTGVRQLTSLDGAATLASVGRDARGATIVTFDANRENDLYRSPRPYRIPIDGGTIERVIDAFGTRTNFSPDGTRVLFDRGGASWSRRGYRGPDARDLWVLDLRDGSYRQLTGWHGNDGSGHWAHDGSIIYLSDEHGGVVNVLRRAANAPPEVAGTAITALDRDARDLSVSADGRMAMFASWGRLYRLDLTVPSAEPRPIAFSAPEDARSETAWRRIDRDVSEARLNPDGKSIAFVAYGDLFVRSMDEKAQAVRITDAPWRAQHIAWSPDGLTLYFTSDEDDREEIRAATVARTRSELRQQFTSASTEAENAADPKPKARTPGDWGDALDFEVRTVVRGTEPVRQPDPSPDGRYVAYRRGPGDLVLRDLTTGDDRVVRRGWDQGIAWRFSPDSRWIAVQQQDRDFNADIWIAPVDGSAPAVNITRHPDADVDPRWSADGRILYFRSDRMNREFDVWSVWLDPTLASKTPAELDQYFKDAVDKARKRKPLPAPGGAAKDAAKDAAAPAAEPDASGEPAADGADGAAGDNRGDVAEESAAPAPRRAPAAKPKEAPEPPPVLSLEDAYLRLRRITTLPRNEGQLEATPGGDRIIFTTSTGSDEDGGSTGGSLFSARWDGTDQKRLGTTASVQEVSLTGDRVVILREGRMATVPPGGGETKSIDFSGSTRIDRAEEMRRRFMGVSRALGEGFYHPTMKDLDWPQLTRNYLELAMAARTADEFDDVAARFLGELNASHMGVSSPSDPLPERRPQGRLGVRSRPLADGFEITEIFPDGPASKSATPLRVGDVIVAVAGRPAPEASTLEELLTARIGAETVVRIRRQSAAGAPVELDALLVPISGQEQSTLAYRATRLANAALVDAWSAGRIGYIHIQGMNQPSLDEFERDLYAAGEGRDGLIIDVRNNGGGWTADRLLASIMAPVHSYTVPRGAEPEYTLGYPRDRLFIQRYPLPITMLANEKSFSNAEITAHAFKTLKRGTLVGETTNGGVISTGSVRLLDGTTVRMPFRGWYLPDGTDMENNGAVPDIRVPQTPEDEASGNDAQLRRAVEELMGRLGPERKRSVE